MQSMTIRNTSKIEMPEQFETPDWVRYFTDFICSKNQKEWDEKKEWRKFNDIKK